MADKPMADRSRSLSESIGLSRVSLLCLSRLKSRRDGFGVAAMDNKMFQFVSRCTQQRLQSRRKGSARRVGDDKMGDSFFVEIGFAVCAPQFVVRARRPFDPIELVGRILPLRRIADDAIAIAALDAGADGLGVDGMFRLGKAAGKLV